MAATTRACEVLALLRDRFGVISRLEYYKVEELVLIITRAAQILQVEIAEEAAVEIAKRSRGTPRIANRLLKRVRDFAQVAGSKMITEALAKEALERLQVDPLGLDHVDHQFLLTIIQHFNGGPVGLDTIAAMIGEEAETIEDVYEPYLMQIGFLQRTPRGRMVTPLCYQHFKLPYSNKGE